MLYPSFDELLALKQKALNLFTSPKQKVCSKGAGNYHSPFRGQGIEFEEVREYAPGDDIRNIDWRVTARAGTPYTKVFRQERERSVILCLDLNGAMRFGTRGTFKSIQAARVAALLGWSITENQDKLGASLFGDVVNKIQFLKPCRSRKSLWAIFQQLSNTKFQENAPYIAVGSMLSHIQKVIPTGALTYIISDFSFIDSTFEQSLSRLRKRSDMVFVTIDDPADQFLPAVGPIGFVDHSGKKIDVNTDDLSGREAYAAQWQQNRQSLKHLAEKLNIGIISIATHEDPHTVLFQGLKGIHKRSLRQ